MKKKKVISTAHKAEVRLVRFLYCDNGCTIRGKLAHINDLAARMQSGIGLTVAMQAMNMLDQLQPVEGLGPVGEIRLVPDIGSYTRLPYAPHSASMMANMVTLDREPWGACARNFLERMIERARQAKKNETPVFATIPGAANRVRAQVAVGDERFRHKCAERMASRQLIYRSASETLYLRCPGCFFI